MGWWPCSDCCTTSATECQHCNTGTIPDQLQVTIEGVSAGSCLNVSVVNMVYVLDRDPDNDCSWSICATYPDDEFGPAGPCYYPLESVGITAFFFGVGSDTYLQLTLNNYDNSTVCDVPIGSGFENWAFRDTTSWVGSTSIDCSTFTTNYPSGNLSFYSGPGIGAEIGWTSATNITVEAI